MGITEAQREEFEAIVRPVIKWLNDNWHPHAMVLIDPTSAELVEGAIFFPTKDYIRD